MDSKKENNIFDNIKLSIQLFDNKNNIFKKSEPLKAKKDSFIFIDKNNKIIFSEQQSGAKENFFLFHLDINGKDDNISVEIDNLIGNNFVYQNIDIINELDDNLWYVIQNRKKNINKKYYLNEGDIIKLGNFKFLVNEISIKDNIQNNENNISEDINYEFCNLESEPFITNKVERYKNYQISSSIDYIPLCECGTLFEFPCFKNHFAKFQKEEREINNLKVKKYIIKNFFCEECNCQYCFSYILPNDNICDSFDIERKDEDYLILESLGTKDKIVYLIYLNKGSIRIGSGSGKNKKNDINDIIIKDASIEEKHALIKYDKGKRKISIESLCDDKFNSFVLIRKEIELKNNKKILLNAGNYFFIVKYNNINELDEEDSYDSENEN